MLTTNVQIGKNKQTNQPPQTFKPRALYLGRTCQTAMLFYALPVDTTG